MLSAGSSKLRFHGCCRAERLEVSGTLDSDQLTWTLCGKALIRRDIQSNLFETVRTMFLREGDPLETTLCKFGISCGVFPGAGCS